MDLTRLGGVGIGVLAIVTVYLFPPFMVIDPTAPETRHSGLGHHPRWNPPTEAAAEALLTREIGPPGPDTGSALDIRHNSVLLTMEIVLVLIGTSAVWLVSARRARAREKQ